MNRERSRRMFEQARQVLVGGVNSPVRAFKSVGGDPVFFSSAAGSKMTDVDGNTYVDYVGSWGPMILGHAHPAVVEALQDAATRGTSFGAPGPSEHRLAELVCKMVPSIEKIRFVNSGTEATMSALRLARGATGRAKVIKFEGCYHGHGDSFLIRAGSGALTFGVPDSAGVTANIALDTLTATFNDAASVQALLEQNPDQVAAVIVEPVAGNMGVIGPDKGFLESLRTLCDAHGALLIFDEVMTGFRVARGGAQQRYGIAPDLTCLGKIIGGGLPVGAYGGPARLMDQVSPDGPIYQAGTLSGNPLAMAAGIETLKQLDSEQFYGRLEDIGAMLEAGLADAATRAGVPVRINRVGSMLTLFFTEAAEVRDFAGAKAADGKRFAIFFNAMLDRNVYLPPSPFEAWFVSAAHTGEDFVQTIQAARQALAELS